MAAAAVIGVVSAIVSTGGFILHEYRNSQTKRKEFEEVKDLLDKLARARPSVGAAGFDSMWGRYRYFLVHDSNSMTWVDLHPGNNSIRVHRWERQPDGRLKRVTPYEVISPENFRKLLTIDRNGVEFARRYTRELAPIV